MPERNTVLDVDGKIYSRLAGSNRLIVSLNEVAPAFIDALLAREDTRFFSTTESILWGRPRACPRFDERLSQGRCEQHYTAACTQFASARRAHHQSEVARSDGGVADRARVHQAANSRALYQSHLLWCRLLWSGDASQAYFGKSASKLNLSEAAVLAGLIRGLIGFRLAQS